MQLKGYIWVLFCSFTYTPSAFVLILFVIRCGVRQSSNLESPEEALDGILGFGKLNSSILSQLASSGKVKKMFAHCLDGDNGGGIFAIGHVVQPKVNSTPLISDEYVTRHSFCRDQLLSAVC